MARLHHFDATTLCPALLTNRFKADLSDDPGRMCCHCVLVETNDGLLLIDTGLFAQTDLEACRVDRVARFTLGAEPSVRTTARGNLEKMGFRAEDVRHVITTHLDLDHAGGLSDFPQAKVHVHAPERRAAEAREHWLEKTRYLPAQWSHGPEWVLHDADGGDTWKGFECVRPIEGLGVDVAIVPLGGHTRGHAGVAVETGLGWLLHAGDAYFQSREMSGSLANPLLEFYQDFLALDPDARRRNRERLRQLARTDRDVRIVCAHAMDELERERL